MSYLSVTSDLDSEVYKGKSRSQDNDCKKSLQKTEKLSYNLVNVYKRQKSVEQHQYSDFPRFSKEIGIIYTKSMYIKMI